MKKIDENIKVTLTFGQLRKLVAERRYLKEFVDDSYGDFVIRNQVLEKYNGHEKYVEIPPVALNIGQYAFKGNKDIVGVKFHDRLVSIGDCAFMDCPNIASITIPENVSKIGAGAFYGSGLVNLVIKSRVVKLDVGVDAFSDCKELKGYSGPVHFAMDNIDVFAGSPLYDQFREYDKGLRTFSIGTMD